MKVFFSRIAESKLKYLTEYLLQEWGIKSKKDFLAELDEKVNQISAHPESCPKSAELGGIFKCVVTKQTTFYYRVDFNKAEIEVITLFDSRQDPEKLKEQLG